MTAVAMVTVKEETMDAWLVAASVVSAEAASPGVGKETTACHAPEAARESATWWSSTGTSSAAKWATRAATVTVGGRPVTKSADGRGRDDEEEEEEEEAREGGEVLPPVV